MSSKKARREAAKRKKKEKIITIITLCVLAAAAIGVFFLVSTLLQDNDRAFVAAGTGNQVILHEDGSFTAELPHNVRKTGTYSEHVVGATTTVLFDVDGWTVGGSIQGRTLTIPSEWDDGCGHTRFYVLR